MRGRELDAGVNLTRQGVKLTCVRLTRRQVVKLTTSNPVVKLTGVDLTPSCVKSTYGILPTHGEGPLRVRAGDHGARRAAADVHGRAGVWRSYGARRGRHDDEVGWRERERVRVAAAVLLRVLGEHALLRRHARRRFAAQQAGRRRRRTPLLLPSEPAAPASTVARAQQQQPAAATAEQPSPPPTESRHSVHARDGTVGAVRTRAGALVGWPRRAGARNLRQRPPPRRAAAGAAPLAQRNALLGRRRRAALSLSRRRVPDAGTRRRAPHGASCLALAAASPRMRWRQRTDKPQSRCCPRR